MRTSVNMSGMKFSAETNATESKNAAPAAAAGSARRAERAGRHEAAQRQDGDRETAQHQRRGQGARIGERAEEGRRPEQQHQRPGDRDGPGLPPPGPRRATAGSKMRQAINTGNGMTNANRQPIVDAISAPRGGPNSPGRSHVVASSASTRARCRSGRDFATTPSESAYAPPPAAPWRKRRRSSPPSMARAPRPAGPRCSRPRPPRWWPRGRSGPRPPRPIDHGELREARRGERPAVEGEVTEVVEHRRHDRGDRQEVEREHRLQDEEPDQETTPAPLQDLSPGWRRGRLRHGVTG